MSKRIFLLFLLLLSGSLLSAQSFNAPPESGRIFAISANADGTISIGEKTGIPLPFGTVDVDWNPVDPLRWARVDNFGLLRFVPEGKDGEGVYTFAPYFDGYQAESGAANKLFMRDVEWSPDGRLLAFRIENAAVPDLNQGVWFWAPIFELSSDPSYQILRHCPPFCSQAGVVENHPGWRSTALEWSADSSAILISVRMLADNRRALTIRYAQRDETQAQAGTGVTNPLPFEYGHWTLDGQRIVVSGHSSDGEGVIFGTIDRSGGNAVLVNAADIGMAWVQNATQRPDGQLVMLGSAEGIGAALQLVAQDGTQLTPPIGASAPDRVSWSPDRSAVMLRIGTRTYVAHVNGAVYDITASIENSPNIDWVRGGLPANLNAVALPAPIAQGEYVPESTPEMAVVPLTVGTLLQLADGTLDIFGEPAADATIIGVLQIGEELIITGGPLQDADTLWYRVQTLNYSGWIRNTATLIVPQN